MGIPNGGMQEKGSGHLSLDGVGRGGTMMAWHAAPAAGVCEMEPDSWRRGTIRWRWVGHSPLRLTDEPAVPLEPEQCYEQTWRDLRIR